jgi:peptidoglycan/xylan/chitin deacetylase (PgdA/CDA1 family)
LEAFSSGLPFDPYEAIENLLEEKYCQDTQRKATRQVLGSLYYLVRPLMGVKTRRLLQRYALRDWQQIDFPAWPIDNTVDKLRGVLLFLSMALSGRDQVYFEWFWPETFQGCVLITHDVETGEGLRFAERLAEIDRSYGFVSSFQLVPEERYEISPLLVENLKEQGHEIAVHGLNHDGRLFSSEQIFRSRLPRILSYAESLGASGFRSPVLYRDPTLLKEIGLDYDMSYPNVGHLDPQRGGCCTVFPFFLGSVVEVPLTTSQDYTLFHILTAEPLEVWREQISKIVSWKGLVSVNVHPDYILGRREEEIYRQLLFYLGELATKHRLWIATPGEVSRWWRERSSRGLLRVEQQDQTQTNGEGKRAGVGIAAGRSLEEFCYWCEERALA